jgi:hypothetical protein
VLVAATHYECARITRPAAPWPSAARGERPDDDDEDSGDPSASAGHGGGAGFDAAVALFNRSEFHTCHNVMEELWYDAEDHARTLLLHDILQCAVGFHHLFNQAVHLIN